jgi:hypothetical protein
MIFNTSVAAFRPLDAFHRNEWMLSARNQWWLSSEYAAKISKDILEHTFFLKII